jgi:phospholipase C
MTTEDGTSTVDASLEIYHGAKGLPGATAGEPGPYGLGQRVPMLVLSPWSKGGYVCSEVFDHTSIIRFLERRFDVFEPSITPWRRAVCGDLTSAFDFAAAHTTVPPLPGTAGYAPPDRLRHPDVVPVPPTDQALPTQEPGTRRARPLPYRLEASASVSPQKVTLQLANHGRTGAVFHLRSWDADPGDMRAQMVTVGAAHHVRHTIDTPSNEYHVEVHGPNGFYRQFAGAPTAGPEVVLADPGSGHSKLVLTNGGPAVDLSITSHYGLERTRVVHVPQGGSVVHPVADPAQGWFDLTVTSGGDNRFVRRLAGHHEDGRPSISDPALGR